MIFISSNVKGLLKVDTDYSEKSYIESVVTPVCRLNMSYCGGAIRQIVGFKVQPSTAQVQQYLLDYQADIDATVTD